MSNKSTLASRRVHRILSSRRGAAAIEFALIAPVILVALTGIVNYGLAMFDKMQMQSAARSGAQLALLDAGDTAAIKQAVVDSTNLGITTSDVTTTQFCECANATIITCGNTCSDGSTNRYFMTVTATYNHTLLLLGTTVALTGSATVRTQ